MARFAVTEAPAALPGSCLTCGGANREFYVDLDIDIEFHGAVYLCSECIREIAQKLGWVANDKIQGMSSTLVLLQSAFEEAQEVFETQKAIHANLTNTHLRLDSVISRVRADSEPSPSEVVAPGIPVPSEGTDGTDSQPAESSDEPGLADVRTDGERNKSYSF